MTRLRCISELYGIRFGHARVGSGPGYFLAFAAFSAARRVRKFAAQPSWMDCRLRVTAREAAGTSRVTTLPAPTIAPSPIVTGAIRDELEPMKAPAPISVWLLKKPS